MKKTDSINLAIEKVSKMYGSCSCCGHFCRADRTKGELGFCRVKEDMFHVIVASRTLHFGEEPILVGQSGSATVFFSGCNLRCVFCQNYQISSNRLGKKTDIKTLSSYFLDLQNQNAVNINLVSATHVIYPVLLALKDAFENGLSLPLVYNTNGYESEELIDALNGVVDIYLPDIKYYSNDFAKKYSCAKNYFETALSAVKKMHAQVGDIVLYKNEVAKQGVIVRHLVLPNNISGSYDVLLALKEAGLLRVTLSIMSQYSPEYKAKEYEEINKSITKKEYEDILSYALDLGFENILAQEFESIGNYVPDFENENPFK